jgi:type VI protein secretion system component Hcp
MISTSVRGGYAFLGFTIKKAIISEKKASLPKKGKSQAEEIDLAYP